MAIIAVFIKDPDATLDYQIDWSDWLDDDTIISSTWIVDTGIVNELDTFTDTATKVWLSGGVSQSRYEATNRITTGDGRIDDRTIRIKVKER